MNNKYLSFVYTSKPKIDYDCEELESSGFRMKARLNKDNPDCQSFINDEMDKGADVKIIKLDSSPDKDNKNIVDIWIKEK